LTRYPTTHGTSLSRRLLPPVDCTCWASKWSEISWYPVTRLSFDRRPIPPERGDHAHLPIPMQ
jgi:hypothetical protein